MNPTILTASGRYFDFINPDPKSIRVFDIGRALSRICRFTGHTTKFYSVAQHSVLVSKVVPPEFALQGLFHDGSEAYLGDVSSPLKQLLPDYKAIEQRVEHAIATAFDLPEQLHPSIKQADLRLLVTEKRDLMPKARIGDVDTEAWAWTRQFEPLPEVIVPMSPDEAYDAFMIRYLEVI
ncbi:metal-dependent phosphohydrolase [Paraburkholderia edwinii]|uniref:Metal-dependent phosphohydrolase n=1 Tax=Paraburkholderia edwinii TaxID=2861782 RepID=A0ABX8UMA9_9BURK|nr:metal-dependent phosphohydrolase [Paraburkholderia edwinii]QYD70125.1 metal-dependent phosphohydrolase [Paraburkholderia edwinii]